nr:protein F47F6.1 [imported] - Caenorhabditis elegans [Caenorhabditis elegans]
MDILSYLYDLAEPVPSTSRHSHHHHHSSLKDQNQGFPANIDLGAYIDKIVEQLVVNSTAQQQQKVAVAAAAAAQAAQAAVVATAQIRKVASAPPTTSTDPPLSYTQINCLENVHRLLKSQSRPESPAKQDEPFDEKKYPPQTPLTREALTLHTKRFEDEYKDTWCRIFQFFPIFFLKKSSKIPNFQVHPKAPSAWEFHIYSRPHTPHPPKNLPIVQFEPLNFLPFLPRNFTPQFIDSQFFFVFFSHFYSFFFWVFDTYNIDSRLLKSFKQLFFVTFILTTKLAILEEFKNVFFATFLPFLMLFNSS